MNCCIDRKSLLEQIYQCEFVLVDINLYLDTHPDCQRAISDYNCYAEQLAMLKKLYTENFGPLENFGNAINIDPEKWLYGTQPFPWQRGYMEV